MRVVMVVSVDSTMRVDLETLVLDLVTIFADSEDCAGSKMEVVLEEVTPVPSTSNEVSVGSPERTGIVSEVKLVL